MDVKFWSKVSKTDGCWNWIGAKNRKGYGNLKRGERYLNAHRYSWELTNGSIPAGKWVLHKCDNPACVRPEHLFLGDVLVNNRDMWTKGRGKSPYFIGHDNPWRWKRVS